MRAIAIIVVTGLLAGPAFAQSAATGQTPPQAPTAGAVLVRLAQNAWADAKRNVLESAGANARGGVQLQADRYRPHVRADRRARRRQQLLLLRPIKGSAAGA